MFKKYFEEYKKDIEFHKAYNDNIDFEEGIDRDINTHQDLINYIENIVMKMSDKDKKNHFFYLMKYKDEYEGDEYTEWFEYINLCKKNFIEHIQECIELDFKEPLEYIDKYRVYKEVCSCNNTRIIFFRDMLKKYLFNKNVALSNDFYVNLQNSTPDYIIYNALDEIDEDIMNIFKNTKEEIIQRIIKYIKYKPLSLKKMCWKILPSKITNSLKERIII